MKWLAGVIWFILVCIPSTILLIITLETLHKLKLLYEYYLRSFDNTDYYLWFGWPYMSDFMQQANEEAESNTSA